MTQYRDEVFAKAVLRQVVELLVKLVLHSMLLSELPVLWSEFSWELPSTLLSELPWALQLVLSSTPV